MMHIINNFRWCGKKEAGAAELPLLKRDKETRRIEKKWTALHLSPFLLRHHFEEVAFLVNTRLIYSIVGYQNSTADGYLKHRIKVVIDHDGTSGIQIKQKGRWVFVKEIQKNLNWNAQSNTFTSKNNPDEKWNYFHNGLVPLDMFYNHAAAIKNPRYSHHNSSLHPIAKLSSTEMLRLRKNAARFTGTSNKASQTEKSCVLQIVTNPRPYSTTGVLKNASSQLASHCGIRLILENGDVYSTGIGIPKDEKAFAGESSPCLGLHTLNQLNLKFLRSFNGQPTIMDHEELRVHEGRVTTSIPIDKASAQKMLAQLNHYRKRSVRFNMFKQNCMSLGTDMLSLAGVDLNIKIPLKHVIYRALPDIKALPLLGKPLAHLKDKISFVCHTVNDNTPAIVKKIVNLFFTIVFYIPAKIEILLENLLIFLLGGTIASPRRCEIESPYAPRTPPVKSEERGLHSFSSLLKHPFDSEASTINHSSILVNWQLQQESTEVHRYSGQPNMQILPPLPGAETAYSKKKKRELQQLYRHSTPVNL